MARLRKISAVLLALALVIGLVPVSFMFQNANAATSATNAIQVTNRGGSTQGTNFGLEISKIIEGTGIENYFDITLTAETTSVKTQESIDVVMVMDISNSMSQLVNGDNGQITRLEAVKSSVYEFLDMYSTNSTLAKLDKRFGLVTFNSLAYNVTINDTYEVTTNGMLSVPGNLRAKGIYETLVDPITYPVSTDVYKSDIWGDLKYDRVRYTNIEGGLQMAQNMLADSTATYKYVVLVTDGFPTTYINSTANPGTDPNFNNRTNINEILGFDCMMENTGWGVDYDKIVDNGGYNADGAFIELLTNVVCDHGVDYSNKAAIKAREVATAMKNNGINIFTIGVGVDDKTIAKNFNDVLKKNDDGSVYYDEYGYPVNTEGYATIDTNGMDEQKVLQGLFEVGDYEDTKAYAEWLGAKIGGGDLLANSDITYLNGNSQSQLHNDIGKILTAIEVAASGRMDDFYVVDPMSKDVEFLGFYDINGEFVPLDTAPTLTGESKLNAENTASFGAEGYANTIFWDLMTSGFTSETVSEGNTTSVTYTFQLKYRVRLKSDVDGFAWNTAVATNDTTTLTYESTYYDVDGNPTGETSKETINFPIPEVQGFCGTLNFLKVDEATNNAPLSNVEFTLVHKGDNCSVCHGDATIDDYTVVTDANGEATISDIVSGHEYTLVETPPMGYSGAADHEVTVSYGKVYVDGVLQENDVDFVITNRKFDPVYVILTAEKTLDGETPAEGAFSFNINGTSQDSKEIDETVKNDANGKITFSPIAFDAIGEYTFTITEIAGDTEGIYYDSATFVVNVTIGLDNQNNCYTATLSGDANAVISGKGEASVGEFKNSTKVPASAEITANKVLTDSEGNKLTLNNGDFEFALYNDAGEIIKTVENDANGLIDFGFFTYNEVGDYIYYMTEIAGDDALIDYDDAEYKVIVTVTEGKTEFTAEVSYILVNDNVDKATFTNVKNDPDAAIVVIEGNKTLVGRDMEDGEFEFVLTDEEGNAIETVTAGASKDGVKSYFEFDAITFDEAGTYIYYVSEVAGDDALIDYDNAEYKVVVVVTEGEAKLNVEVSYVLGNDTVDEIAFNNVNNDPEPAIVTIGGNKTLVGRDMEKDEFEFVLVDEDGNIIDTVTSGASANKVKFDFDFDALTFTEEGTYNYTVYEKKGDIENITYDETVYEITVEVTYDGEGKLVADVTVDGNEYAPLEFVNEYTVIPEAGDSFALYFYVSIILATIAISGLVISKKNSAF